MNNVVVRKCEKPSNLFSIQLTFIRLLWTMALNWKETLKNVHSVCVETVKSLGFHIPTPVQANTIPQFTNNKDVVVEVESLRILYIQILIPMPIPLQKGTNRIG